MSRIAAALTPSRPRRSSRSGPWRLAATSLALVLLAGACGSEGDPLADGTVVKDGIACTPEVDRKSDDKPAVEKVATAPEEVVKDDLVEGTGCEADPASYLAFDLIGATATDGTVFTDSWEDGRPITVKLGTQQLIPGLEDGLAGMKVGGRRMITVPAALAYGADGNPDQEIGPDEALVFVADLVAVTPKVAFCNPATVPEGVVEGKPTAVEMPVEAPADEVETTVLTEGDGAELTQADYVTVNYAGIACSTGQQFDSSWDADPTTGEPREPFTIAMAEATPTETAGTVITGWPEGLVGQKVGALVQLNIPSKSAYGPTGNQGIAPDEPLVFVIQIISASAEAPAAPTTTVPAGDPAATTVPAGDPAATTVPAGDPAATTVPAGDPAATTVPAGDPAATTVPAGDPATTTAAP